MKNVNDNIQENLPKSLPVVPTMDVVVFPNMIVPLLVLDDRIIRGINYALDKGNKMVLLLASKKASGDDQESISTKDLYKVGTIATIMRLINLPEGGIKILVQGVSKAIVNKIIADEGILKSDINNFIMQKDLDNPEVVAQIKNIKSLAEKISSSGYSFSPDFHIILSKMSDPEKISDFILSYLDLEVEDSQQLLEAPDQISFLQGIGNQLLKELEVSKIQENIKNNARESMNSSQREFYLREQLKAIKKELGEDDVEEIDEMRTKLNSLPLPDEVRKEVNRQMNRLEKTAPESMESAVTRNYLEWISELPWDKSTQDNLELSHAKEVLDHDHYGLKEIKDRILDFIALRKIKSDGKTPILCFVGPPGTGKTSLGKSIAKSLGRNYFRISLGGVKDEAEIRGHRRTYVGAMPGRFIQGIRKAESNNPVIIIDELDKIGSDFRGDPSAAMLEVLDPQQNKTFYDNYLNVPFDLSQTLFVATANTLESLSGPLRDRLEVIELSGYTHEEKLNIAKNHLLKKAINESGLTDNSMTINDEVISYIIANFTRESGVRELDRVIKKLCSKAVRELVENNKTLEFDIDNIEKYLGPCKFKQEEEEQQDSIGICNGLAWTSFGGQVLKVETIIMPGKGKLLLTGQLGDVMKESAQAALSYIKSHCEEFEIEPEIFKKYDIHIHVPAGAVPKDGPSAGVTLLSSILSAITKRPINCKYAMTGEINLRGNVMPIGGVKEKILAAKRNKIPHIILPYQNKADLTNLEEVAKGIDVIWVKHANEIIGHVLMNKELSKKASTH